MWINCLNSCHPHNLFIGLKWRNFCIISWWCRMLGFIFARCQISSFRDFVMLMGQVTWWIEKVRMVMLYLLVYVWSIDPQENNGTLAGSCITSEYQAIATAVTELEWIKAPVRTLNSGTNSSIPMWHIKMKHVAMDLHYACKRVKDGTVHATHISRWHIEQLCWPKSFLEHRCNLMVPSPQAWGGMLVSNYVNLYSVYIV